MIRHFGCLNSAPQSLSIFALFEAVGASGYQLAITGDGVDVDELFAGYDRFSYDRSVTGWIDRYLVSFAAVLQSMREQLYHPDFRALTNASAPFARRKPARWPLPEHLPRERFVYPAPTACPCCGDNRLRKIGEDVTETLELIPRQWKVIQHVREKLVCRACEAITQPPAPSHPIARGRAGPRLLAHILFAKYGLHLPLNRQSEVYQREGVDLDISTLADWVGAAAATLMPLRDVIRTHVFAAERIYADDTTVPVLAKGKTRTGRLWTYVRDDRPFAGPDPPAAVFFYSPDRGGAHPEQHLTDYAGLMQADAYAGFGKLYEANRKGDPIIEAACWAHGRRKFFDLARLSKAPIAAEAVKRIDVLFAIERRSTGLRRRSARACAGSVATP
jgi:transposase